MQAYFERFTIEMTLQQARSASHQGRCDSDVVYLTRQPHIRRQLAKIQDDVLRAELREVGAWDSDELQDRDQNEQRIIWIAACNISEKHATRRTSP